MKGRWVHGYADAEDRALRADRHTEEKAETTAQSEAVLFSHPRDAVIAGRSGELDQIEAVAERVGHIGDPAIFAALDVAVEAGSERQEACDYGVEIAHQEVQANRCPMALVAALGGGATEIGESRPAGE